MLLGERLLTVVLLQRQFFRSSAHSLEVPMHSDSSLHWKDVLLQALDESDRERLHRLVREAEVAIFHRREELGDSVEAREELSTMAVATEAYLGHLVNTMTDTSAESHRATALMMAATLVMAAGFF